MITRPLILLAPDAPAKAAAAPPPAPAPAPSPAPAPAPAPDLASGSDPFKEIEGAFKSAGDVVEDTPPKPSGGEPAKPADAPPPSSPKPADAPPAPKAPEKATADPVRTPKELRAELDRTKSELQSTMQTHQKVTADLEAKIKDYDAKGKDAEALRSRLEEREKEFDRIQGELRALKQEASPEFKKQYDAPIDQAISVAQSSLSRIEKIDGTPLDFWKDIAPIYKVMKTSWNKADAMLEELVGEKAGRAIMGHLERIDGLEQIRDKAFEEEKKGWAEKQKQDEGLQTQQRLQVEDARKRVRQELPTTPENEAYRDPPEDKELAAARARGLQIYDAKPADLRQEIWKQEHERQRVGAFEVQKVIIGRLQKENAALKAENEKLRPRQPNADPSRTGTAPAPAATENEDTWASGLKEAAQTAR